MPEEHNRRMVDQVSIILLPLHVLIGAITYTGIIRRMKILNEEDVQLIKGIFGEKIARNIGKIMNIQ